MSPRSRAVASSLLLGISGVAAVTAAVACGGPETNEPSPNVPSKPKQEDKTEVTMEAIAVAPSSSSPPPTSTGSTTVTPTTGPDPSEDPNIGGVQSDPVIEKAVAPTRTRLRACYKKAVAAEPNVGGSSTFDVTIGKDGKPATVRFVKRNGLNEDMVSCLLPAIKAMTFEGVQKSQILTLSFGTPPPTPVAPADAGAAPKK